MTREEAINGCLRVIERIAREEGFNSSKRAINAEGVDVIVSDGKSYNMARLYSLRNNSSLELAVSKRIDDERRTESFEIFFGDFVLDDEYNGTHTGNYVVTDVKIDGTCGNAMSVMFKIMGIIDEICGVTREQAKERCHGLINESFRVARAYDPDVNRVSSYVHADSDNPFTNVYATTEKGTSFWIASFAKEGVAAEADA